MATSWISYWLYIHPPLAFVGYVFIFLFTRSCSPSAEAGRRVSASSSSGRGLDRFTFLGLLTGIALAHTAWGFRYWTWDPQSETHDPCPVLGRYRQSLVAYYESIPGRPRPWARRSWP